MVGDTVTMDLTAPQPTEQRKNNSHWFDRFRPFLSLAIWLFVPVTISLVIIQVSTRNSINTNLPFHELNLSRRISPVTYSLGGFENGTGTAARIAFHDIPHHNHEASDVTAVVLNWSRLPNVVSIASLLCSPLLEDIVSEVFIWNNSPQILSHNTFAEATCPSHKLRIYNSPSNLYFQARFLACEQGSSQYCFIQDDDYLVLPEIIRSLRTRMERSPNTRNVHLLPPHEHLSSQLRVVHTDNGVHTSFAWLGHGTMIRKSEASNFLALLHQLNASETEMMMADNYFTILTNRIPEVWFDQGIELGGGQPFTSGTEGDERNKRHITQAGQYLDSLVYSRNPPIQENVGTISNPIQEATVRTPCLGISCLLSTNIPLLPDTLNYKSNSASSILTMEKENTLLLGEDKTAHYLAYPPSHAVDGRSDTAFCSPETSRNGQVITLDIFSSVGRDWATLEMVWLVDTDTEQILRASKFAFAEDYVTWVAATHELSCVDTDIPSVRPARGESYLRECTIEMVPGGPDAHLFRVKLAEDLDVYWCIYEVWLRGLQKESWSGLP